MKRCFAPKLNFALMTSLIFVLVGCGVGSSHIASTQNPLVARYTVAIEQTGDLTVEFGTDTNYGRQTATYPVTPGMASILVAGMKAATTYHMRARLSTGGSVVWTDQDRIYNSGAIPVPVPELSITRSSDPAVQATENPGVELVTFYPAPGTTGAKLSVADRDGNTIWYYDAPGDAKYFKFMPNGHILLATLISSDVILREIDLAGRTVRELHSYALQQALQSKGYAGNFLSFSHDFIPMENGHTIVLGLNSQDFTDLPGYPGTTTVTGDIIVDLDENWNPGWMWSAFDHLDVNRHPMFFPDWTHGNAIVYNPNDGSLLFSMRHQSWIVDIDYGNGLGTGNVLWRLGYQGDFTLPGNDPTQWFAAQHYPSFINIDGQKITMAIFDNGDYRPNADGTSCQNFPFPTCYTRATIFQLDEATRQASLLWQYLPEMYSFWGGSIAELGNGNVEFDMSEPFPVPTVGSRVLEVTQGPSPQVVWQMDISGGFSYRSYRIPSLYPNVTWQ